MSWYSEDPQIKQAHSTGKSVRNLKLPTIQCCSVKDAEESPCGTWHTDVLCAERFWAYDPGPGSC